MYLKNFIFIFIRVLTIRLINVGFESVVVVTSSCGRCSCIANYFSTRPLFTYE